MAAWSKQTAQIVAPDATGYAQITCGRTAISLHPSRAHEIWSGKLVDGLHALEAQVLTILANAGQDPLTTGMAALNATLALTGNKVWWTD